MERKNIQNNKYASANKFLKNLLTISAGIVFAGAFAFFAFTAASFKGIDDTLPIKGRKHASKNAEEFVPPGLAKKLKAGSTSDETTGQDNNSEPVENTDNDAESVTDIDNEDPLVEESSSEADEYVEEPSDPQPEPSPYFWGMGTDITLQESGSPSGSTNNNWWLNSGAYFSVVNGIGRTVQGELSSSDKWRELYNKNNPLDTDGGYHPQNIFRLVTKTAYQNIEQSGYFKINRTVMSSSPNRAGHNGLLFFNRYIDGDNLYYTGIRVDGRAIIKKKQNGNYYTLASSKILPGTYDTNINPNLLPENKWIGIKSVIENNPDGSVNIRVYADMQQNGTWSLVAQARDDNSSNGTPIAQSGRAGIRTDFMDVEFKDYSI